MRAETAFWFCQSKFLDPVADLIAVDAEQRTGACLIAAAPFERLNDQLPLDLVERDTFRRQPERCRHRIARER